MILLQWYRAHWLGVNLALIAALVLALEFTTRRESPPAGGTFKEIMANVEKNSYHVGPVSRILLGLLVGVLVATIVQQVRG